MLKAIRDRNSVFRIALNLTAASLISGAVLAATYFFTKPYAEKQRARIKEMSMRELIPQAGEFRPVDGKEGWVLAVSNGTALGYILPTEGKGYGGSIKMLVAADTNERIIDYKILSHNETPGLGDRAAGTDFRSQFRDKAVTNLEVVKKHDTNFIDALTGATITSRAVTRAVREELERLAEYLKGRKGNI